MGIRGGIYRRTPGPLLIRFSTLMRRSFLMDQPHPTASTQPSVPTDSHSAGIRLRELFAEDVTAGPGQAAFRREVRKRYQELAGADLDPSSDPVTKAVVQSWSRGHSPGYPRKGLRLPENKAEQAAVRHKHRNLVRQAFVGALVDLGAEPAAADEFRACWALKDDASGEPGSGAATRDEATQPRPSRRKFIYLASAGAVIVAGGVTRILTRRSSDPYGSGLAHMTVNLRARHLNTKTWLDEVHAVPGEDLELGVLVTNLDPKNALRSVVVQVDLRDLPFIRPAGESVTLVNSNYEGGYPYLGAVNDTEDVVLVEMGDYAPDSSGWLLVPLHVDEYQTGRHLLTPLAYAWPDGNVSDDGVKQGAINDGVDIHVEQI